MIVVYTTQKNNLILQINIGGEFIWFTATKIKEGNKIQCFIIGAGSLFPGCRQVWAQMEFPTVFTFKVD